MLAQKRALWAPINFRPLAAWGPLALILAAALAIRVSYLPMVGFGADLNDYGVFITLMRQVGLFKFYTLFSGNRLYPPLTVASFALVGEVETHLWPFPPPFPDPILNVFFGPLFQPLGSFQMLMLIKLPPLLADLIVILVAYVWLRDKPALRWIIPGLLAISPGLIANSMWWGQYDSIAALFLILALIALNRDRPLLAWAMFGLALLTKQQAVILTPLLLVLTFRRYGWRRLIEGIVLCGLLGCLVLAPFVAGSGLRAALRPYVNASDPMAFVTNDALNPWYIFSVLAAGTSTNLDWVGTDTPHYAQVSPLGLTYNLIGYLALAVYVLIITAAPWRRYSEKREFVWAAALYMAAFMLPAASHERHLYTAAVIVLLAIAQDWRLMLAAIGITFTFGYNMAQVADPLPWPGRQWLWITSWQLEVALLNLILVVELTRITLTQPGFHSRLSRILSAVDGVGALAVILGMVVLGVPEALANSATASWLSKHVASYSLLVAEINAREIKTVANGFGDPATWDWQFIRPSNVVPVGKFPVIGAHYLVIDERAHPGSDFDRTIQAIQNQGAALLWQSGKPFALIPRQAVFWTAHPQVLMNLSFDQNLTLIGYDVLTDRPGAIGLLLHWYTLRSTPAAYHVFLHLIDPQTGKLLDQVDAPLGQAGHFSNTWRPNERVIETNYLPTRAVGVDGICHLRLGLYDYESGVRAQISPSDGKAARDYIELTLPCALPAF